ncbi:MAG: hypothetical protein KAI43_10225 [Candidatus Aureabacteria bacterium]|nr:hypothetical protein [Candidatus Auribacterota bacterium]
MNANDNYFGKVIYQYTSEQAEEDGILFDITKLNDEWKKGLFNYVTTNLMSKGYLDEKGSINLPNLLDLLNQANLIVKIKSNYFHDSNTFYAGQIELPSGERQEIFIEQNETGKFTVLLPEDH